MSEVTVPPRPQYDFLKPLTFVFEDPKWIEKVLFGALFSLAGVVLIGIFFVYGYLARLVRNVVAGVERPLPEWTDLGDMFAEGALLFVASLLYILPMFFLFFLTVPFSLLADLDNYGAQAAGAGGLVLLTLILVPAGFALAVWVPAAMLHAAVKRDFRAAFDFRTIAAFIRNNAVNYVLAYLDWIVARMASPLGFLLCCVGVFLTAFWAVTVAGYSFAQVYRMSEHR
jgi:hypothetical protein